MNDLLRFSYILFFLLKIIVNLLVIYALMKPPFLVEFSQSQVGMFCSFVDDTF